MNATVPGTFEERCLYCKTLNKIKKQDLYNKVLGAGVTKYSFPQYCTSCRTYLGTWTCVEKAKDAPLEFTFTPVKRKEVWCPTIYATPPRRHRHFKI